MNAPEEVREIYVLNKLKSRYMWAGTAVHDSVSDILGKVRLGLPCEPEKILNSTREKMRSDFRSSRDGEYWSNPKTCALFEHEYDIDITQEQWKGMWEQVERCIRNFYESDIFSEIRAMDASSWLPIEEFQSFKLNGDKINVKLDFPFKDTDGSIVIVDWKTGRSKSSGNNIQLACYALFALSKWQAEIEKLKTVEYNLLSMDRIEKKVNDEIINSVKNIIIESVSEMKLMLRDVEANRAEKEDFPMIEDTGKCDRCNFKKICFPR